MFSLVDIDFTFLNLITNIDEHLLKASLILFLHVLKEGARVVDYVLKIESTLLWAYTLIGLFDWS